MSEEEKKEYLKECNDCFSCKYLLGTDKYGWGHCKLREEIISEEEIIKRLEKELYNTKRQIKFSKQLTETELECFKMQEKLYEDTLKLINDLQDEVFRKTERIWELLKEKEEWLKR